MPYHYEWIESRRKRRNRNADNWGAALAGGVLFALPVSAGLFRGSFGWMEVVVAVIGIASLVSAAEGFMRSRPRQRRVTRFVRRLCSGW